MLEEEDGGRRQERLRQWWRAGRETASGEALAAGDIVALASDRDLADAVFKTKSDAFYAGILAGEVQYKRVMATMTTAPMFPTANKET